MQGKIGVESVAGEGSNFWFTAEVESAMESMPPQLLTPSLLENHRALIVDDNATNRKLLTHLCEAWQLPHEATADAQAALEALRRAAAESDPFDVVILDHHMPDIDGLGLAALVREDVNIPQPKLVLLSSRGERFNKSEMVAHSLAACELKPLHPQRLRNTLSRVLGTPTLTSGKVNTTPPIPVQAPVLSHPGALPVLIAEDNIVNQKVTLLQLRKLGYTGEVVNNGREAVEAVQKKRYALVLMDAQMPELDGIAATREIRAAQAAGQPGFPAKLRIIAMTANAMTGDREMCLDAGMDDYLSKPVTPDALRGILDRYAARESKAKEPLPACTLAS
jgi:CheY-like chemotaxis protein